MKNTIFAFTALLFLFAACNVSAQIYVEKGDLEKLLMDQEAIGIRFTYNNMSVDNFGAEENYVAQKVERYNKLKEGKGNRWKKAWINNRFCHFQPEFMHLITKRTAKTNLQFLDNAEDTKYTMVVNTDYIALGFDALIVKKPAQVATTIKIIETATNKEVAVLKATAESSRYTEGYTTLVSKNRVGQAYKKIGKIVGKHLAKLLS